MSENNNVLNNLLYDTFLEKLEDKCPKGKSLAQSLMDLLGTEEGATYRRLRKDTLFPFNEILKISAAWNISIDEIMGIASDKINFQMSPINFYNPQKEDFGYMQELVDALNSCKDDSTSECIEICNKLPRSLLVKFPLLGKFYLHKWLHQHSEKHKNILFSQITIPEAMGKVIDDFTIAIRKIKEVDYIFDKFLFNYIVEDIRHIHEIELITDAEKELLKNDLLALLDYLLGVANTGVFPEANNKVNFYVSHINLDASYSYFGINDFYLFRIHALDEHELKNYDKKTVLELKKILELKKDSTFKISSENAKSRIKYFAEQREIINRL